MPPENKKARLEPGPEVVVVVVSRVSAPSILAGLGALKNLAMENINVSASTEILAHRQDKPARTKLRLPSLSSGPAVESIAAAPCELTKEIAPSTGAEAPKSSKKIRKAAKRRQKIIAERKAAMERLRPMLKAFEIDGVCLTYRPADFARYYLQRGDLPLLHRVVLASAASASFAREAQGGQLPYAVLAPKTTTARLAADLKVSEDDLAATMRVLVELKEIAVEASADGAWRVSWPEEKLFAALKKPERQRCAPVEECAPHG